MQNFGSAALLGMLSFFVGCSAQVPSPQVSEGSERAATSAPKNASDAPTATQEKMASLPSVPMAKASEAQEFETEDDGGSVKTKYGRVRLVESEKDGESTVTVLFNDKQIGTLEGNDMNGFGSVRYLIGASEVYVLSQVGGAKGCGSYEFLSVHSASSAEISDSFFSCGEVAYDIKLRNDELSVDTWNMMDEPLGKVVFKNFKVKLPPSHGAE